MFWIVQCLPQPSSDMEMLTEQPHLLPLAAVPFDLAEISFPTMAGHLERPASMCIST